MAYCGLNSFVNDLEAKGELIRIKPFVNPNLEITEITDRISKSSGPALLFENTGSRFPLLINAFGSDSRMAMAIGRENLDDAAKDIEEAFARLTGSSGNLLKKITSIPRLLKMAAILPSRSKSKGKCQHVIIKDTDLDTLPVLKCWPYDGGKFITLPIVHTIHPQTGKTNAGMYRMQILDKNTTAMHWQLHKTGASHFRAWKELGKRMPVSVALGGDPVYTYAATAPLPENIDEYILAGFLRKKRVKLVKCITNELYVPEDADIVLEGYVDTAEDLVWEGPFGDHTGFYSLADWYPKFHITCITHSYNPVYPATIVGIPPQEDAFLAKATEKIFLAPVKLSLQPEVEDFHMPDPGIAHNFVIVKIRKSYPGQGIKVINSLFGAGQMMFTKYMIVVNGNVDIRNYRELASHLFRNADFKRDLIFTRGPMDVLDHSSDAFAFGGKLGIDGTIKDENEKSGVDLLPGTNTVSSIDSLNQLKKQGLIFDYTINDSSDDKSFLIISLNRRNDSHMVEKTSSALKQNGVGNCFRLILFVDHTVVVNDFFTVAWQVLGNSDPVRDHIYIDSSLAIDGTIKAFQPGGFARKWPNVVCSDHETIATVDSKWDKLGIGEFIASPSLKAGGMKQPGNEEIIID